MIKLIKKELENGLANVKIKPYAVKYQVPYQRLLAR